MKSMKKLRKFAQRHIVRPVIYMTFTRFLAALAVVLIWERFFNTSGLPNAKMFGFSFAAVLFALLAWIAYLRLDGLKMPKLLMKRVNIRKKPTRSYGDMIDYTDEEPVSFDELEDDEKDFCILVSDLICCLAYFALSFL